MSLSSLQQKDVCDAFTWGIMYASQGGFVCLFRGGLKVGSAKQKLEAAGTRPIYTIDEIEREIRRRRGNCGLMKSITRCWSWWHDEAKRGSYEGRGDLVWL